MTDGLGPPTPLTKIPESVHGALAQYMYLNQHVLIQEFTSGGDPGPSVINKL